MYGAIIGDLARSIYEYSQVKKVNPFKGKEIIKKLELGYTKIKK